MQGFWENVWFYEIYYVNFIQQNIPRLQKNDVPFKI